MLDVALGQSPAPNMQLLGLSQQALDNVEHSGQLLKVTTTALLPAGLRRQLQVVSSPEKRWAKEKFLEEGKRGRRDFS